MEESMPFSQVSSSKYGDLINTVSPNLAKHDPESFEAIKTELLSNYPKYQDLTSGGAVEQAIRNILRKSALPTSTKVSEQHGYGLSPQQQRGH
jgi:hypothetical protein